ncbi:hypothetical protein B0H34DRAFT_674917 [Crassisporium funariophilum]|nr:hypothetical protein B0H34DRAFT_674917 [Crassisporium funariophilum]
MSMSMILCVASAGRRPVSRASANPPVTHLRTLDEYGFALPYLHQDFPSLKNCSLVCRAWLYAAHWHMFHRIAITAHNLTLLASLINNPHSTIPPFVKRLELGWLGAQAVLEYIFVAGSVLVLTHLDLSNLISPVLWTFLMSSVPKIPHLDIGPIVKSKALHVAKYLFLLGPDLKHIAFLFGAGDNGRLCSFTKQTIEQTNKRSGLYSIIPLADYYKSVYGIEVSPLIEILSSLVSVHINNFVYHKWCNVLGTKISFIYQAGASQTGCFRDHAL